MATSFVKGGARALKHPVKNSSLINLQDNAFGLMSDNVMSSLVQSDYIGYSKLDLDQSSA